MSESMPNPTPADSLATPAASSGSMPYLDQRTPWPPAARQEREGRRELNLRTVLLTVASLVLALALIAAFRETNRVIDIWFDYQYAAIARMVLAASVAVAAVYAIRTLVRGRVAG